MEEQIGLFLPCRFYTEWCTGKTQRDGVGREGAGGMGWGIHVNPWLIHVNVWQKLQNKFSYCIFCSIFLSFFFCCYFRILVLLPGIEPRPSAVKAWNPHHGPIREFLVFVFNSLLIMHKRMTIFSFVWRLTGPHNSVYLCYTFSTLSQKYLLGVIFFCKIYNK